MAPAIRYQRSPRSLTWEKKPVELRGFEPLTFCMPCSS